MTLLSRRSFLSHGAAAGGASILSISLLSENLQASEKSGHAMPMPQAANALEKNLDAYIAVYMPAMHEPGLTLGMTDAAHTVQTGYSSVEVDVCDGGYALSDWVDYEIVCCYS